MVVFYNWKVLALIVIGITIMLTPTVNPVFASIPVVSRPSISYDCDDAALDLYQHFKEIGIQATPIVGNMDLTGENFTQCNHVWILANINNEIVAYDWGQPRFDQQHYEGFKIDLDYLEYAALMDKENPDLSKLANDSQ